MYREYKIFKYPEGDATLAVCSGGIQALRGVANEDVKKK
jgi:hypothetical protein